MAEVPAYVILGRGRWAKRMHPIIAGEDRRVSCVKETRQHAGESEATYISRLAAQMKASGAQIAWLCVAPGPHVCLMIQAALEAGLHVIVEKPWYATKEETQRLQDLAREKRRLIAVNFEYLVLTEVEKWKAEFYPGAGLRFSGRFFLSRSDKSGIPPIDNLGCHLLAIREFAVPSSEVAVIQSGYERPDERVVWIERAGQRLASIDLFTHGQPIIQRFLKKMEGALDAAAFPFDLDFAYRVAGQLNAYKTRNAL
ncbi:MAG TPA: Gfo/Idh/MocA family oxidoreductase [Candidatus Angelobacter sp.]|nr:Gfo/Idh/MocA family oxidoreductase [Candidatus Angelobacter sp.]